MADTKVNIRYAGAVVGVGKGIVLEFKHWGGGQRGGWKMPVLGVVIMGMVVMVMMGLLMMRATAGKAEREVESMVVQTLRVGHQFIH